jgi:signal transduction histidine kinase
MPKPVRVLHLEDDAADSELILSALQGGGVQCEVRWVTNRADFTAALRDGGFDLILADYHLPSFDGTEALNLARVAAPNVPFLFVSGFMGEEVALESLKQGAVDYVFKHNLVRLAPAVLRALQESHDQRERRAAQAALQESETTLRSFFDTAPFMLGIVALLPDDLLFVSGNAATARFLKVQTDAVGRRRASDLGMPPAVVSQWSVHLREAAERGVPVEFEHTYPVAGQVRHLSVTVSELPASPGQPNHFCYVAADTTEKRQLEQQFLRAQRLESIGTLASGIAHDLNNVLAPIIMALKLFRPKLTDVEDQELLRTLETSARRGADIVRQVLTFARGVEGERRPLDLKRLVGEISGIARDTFPRSIQIETEVVEKPWKVVGDPTQIYQVLMNLCVNARDAMPNGGRLTLTVGNITLDERAGRLPADARPGDYLRLRVGDTGGGISQELQSRIFDPFFTTKEVGKGTGLGLATALTIVKSHGGFIDVWSEAGRGTEFDVFLPAEQHTAAVPPELPGESIPRGSGELVLVVDDERSIRQVTKVTLSDHGYQVLTAAEGAEGIALFAQNSERIRLVITDMMMPLMDGAALIKSLQQIEPGVRILAVSGLLESGAPPPSAGAASVTFLQKPFTAEKLLQAVYDAIHSPPAPLLL